MYIGNICAKVILNIQNKKLVITIVGLIVLVFGSTFLYQYLKENYAGQSNLTELGEEVTSEEKAEENKKQAESYTTEHDTQTQSEVIDVDAREFRYTGDAPVRQKVNMLCLIGPAIAVPGLISIFNVLGLGAIIVSIIGYLKAERLEQKGKEAAVFGIILGATELGVMLARLFF